jgi:DNA-binding MarR family transcriptional regulator
MPEKTHDGKLVVLLGGRKKPDLKPRELHPKQKLILEIYNSGEHKQRTLRELGEMIDVDHPQKVKHHLKQLEKRGLIKVERRRA